MVTLLRNLFGRPRGSSAKPAAAPTSAEWRSRGNAALAQGDLQEAVRCYSCAVESDPSDPAARLNLGFALLETGEPARAQECLARAIALRRPEDNFLHEAHYLLGRALARQGRADEALASFRSAAHLRPDFAEPLEEGARLLHGARRYDEALEWARRLHGARPSADSGILVAQQLYGLRRHEEALALLDGILASEPAHAAAWTGRGHVLVAMARGREAVEAFERALALAGPTPDALADSAGALAKANRLDEALQRVERALQQDPGHRAAMCNRLNILTRMTRIDEALAAGRDALRAHPQDAETHWNFAIACLLGGRFEEGWREHEWRRHSVAAPPPHPAAGRAPQWTGAQDLQGRTILLFGEQGYGDALQMIRYVPRVAARAARVVLQLPAGLHGLKLTSGLGPSVVVAAAGEALPPLDFQCSLMSLPLAFGSDETTIPRDVPYLRADPQRVQSWQRRLLAAGDRLKVGVVWSGRPEHTDDANRSIALATMGQLAAEGCFFVSLQPQVRDSDRAALEQWPGGLQRWGEELADFDDTAALVEALDLVVSVDTSVAHLASALARPVWVLLPHCPDWRWLLAREDSPWYPTARLYRQDAPGDWPRVLARVKADLEKLARGA